MGENKDHPEEFEANNDDPELGFLAKSRGNLNLRPDALQRMKKRRKRIPPKQEFVLKT